MQKPQSSYLDAPSLGPNKESCRCPTDQLSRISSVSSPLLLLVVVEVEVFFFSFFGVRDFVDFIILQQFLPQTDVLESLDDSVIARLVMGIDVESNASGYEV